LLLIIYKYFTGHATSGFGETSAGGTTTKFNPVTGTGLANRNVGQSKPVGTPLALPTSNLFSAPQTNTVGHRIFGASTTGNT